MAAYEEQLASSTAASSAPRIDYHVSVHAVDEVRARPGARARAGAGARARARVRVRVRVRVPTSCPSTPCTRRVLRY